MTFNRFMAFVAVVKHRNITKAARELGVTQPSVSKHIKALEVSYKVQLFEKNTSGLELTDEGRRVFRYASAILSLLKRLEKTFMPLDGRKKAEPLRIAGSYTASTRFLPSLLARFKRQHPEIPITLRTGSSNNLEKMLLNSEVEIALLNRKATSPRLVAQPFREEKLVLFVAPSHPLARKKDLSVSDINNATLAGAGGNGKSSTTEKILTRHAQDGLTAKITIRCATPEAVKTIVRKGIGVGILFQDTVMAEIRKGAFKALKLPGLKLVGHSHIVYSHDKPISNHAREFLSLLRKWRDD